MALLGRIQRLFGGASPVAAAARWTHEGVVIPFEQPLTSPSAEGLEDAASTASASQTVLLAYLLQLAQAGRLQLSSRQALLPWSQLFELLASPEHQGSLEFFELPASVALRPVLDSSGTLADEDFAVSISGWAHPDTGEELETSEVVGAVATVDGREVLLPRAAWQLTALCRQLAATKGRSRRDNELAWGAIRPLADESGAFYKTPFLRTTYVVTPQTLRLPVRREDTPFGRVLTVEPTFDGAPAGWLKAFDGFNSVQQHYDLVAADGGHVRVVLSEPVLKVLQVIRREMPSRQVAGSRAEKFLHNPWAFLGEGSEEVLRPEEFERDRAAGGAQETRFSITPRVRQGRIDGVELEVQQHFNGGFASSTATAFEGPNQLADFLQGLKSALGEQRQHLAWGEFDLDLDADAERKLAFGEQALKLWQAQPAESITYEEVFELAGYSNRVEGIGAARAIYVPVLQKPRTDDEADTGWLPADAAPMVRITLEGHPEPVLVPLTKEWLEDFDKKVSEAQRDDKAEVTDASLPTAIGTPQAKELVQAFRSMMGVSEAVKGDKAGEDRPKRERKPGETLLVKTNLVGVDYIEERKQRLALPPNATARLPKCLQQSVELRQHQLNGVAWFQHLVQFAPVECRGALLGDDMGLGKTIQLLAVIGRYYEEQPNAAPSIVIAPKTLVDNWAAEVGKFFDASFPKALVLYGEELQARRQPLGLIDQRLQDRGIVELLKPNWAGDAKLIITTYETLTRYEFSMARQPFAFLVCDEAQRIKTPGTQVSLAVRALKADFRIACTGTPVENTLADLWCLFDFIQPGLLGALEEFSRTYRRPIECTTDDHREALARLQSLIQPQTLRRTKMEIANELKRKLFAVSAGQSIAYREKPELNERLEVPLSMHQVVLYRAGLKKLQDASAEKDGRKRARLSFGALHLIKAVCAEPYCLPGMKFKPAAEGHDKHLENSPKLAWLLNHLEQVRQAGEKALVFTELREVQAALYYFLKVRFGLRPHIINGDTQGRQRYVDAFSQSEGFNVILLSTLAAGAGLNITAANHVFHFTRAWNPAKENQATDRAYRIGQEKDVYVYCPLAVTPEFVTFDVRLDELMRRKARLSDATIGGSSMESMLNGVAEDVSLGELVRNSGEGAAAPVHYLTMDDVDRMDGLRFEVLCEMLWSRAGFLARVTDKKKGDAGIDVVAIKGGFGELLQVKCSVNDNVGWDAVKEVVAGAPVYQAMMPGVKLRRLAVTNQHFSESTRQRAAANQVHLVERESLESMLASYPMTSDELESRTMEVALSFNAA